MFIKQIIEFEMTGSGPPGRTVLLHLTKQKSPRNIFMWIVLLFTGKILQEAMDLTSHYLGQITYKI